ncbi:helix-turn-helix transcriptional regulator [Aquimarina sp. 2201CG1-2-11]|uniref:response regulator transcription factor n=1 Tax=Aquimarina discodermiae TaxID=3231043 RepID=UPI00346363A6
MKSQIIYDGIFLRVAFERINDLFVQSWNTTPKTIDSFKSELLTYVAYYKKYQPTKSLWLHQNFGLHIDDDTKVWIENRVNIPCKQYGNQKLAFVVCIDLLVHLNIIETFDKTKSVIIPKHFATEKEARTWLNKENIEQSTIIPSISNDTKVQLDKVDERGNCIINIKSPTGTITNTIRSFKGLLGEKSFSTKKKKFFSSLTCRERQILFLYASGVKHKEISLKLHISLYTVRTHWRNIKRKLQITSFKDILEYAQVFQD